MVFHEQNCLTNLSILVPSFIACCSGIAVLYMDPYFVLDSSNQISLTFALAWVGVCLLLVHFIVSVYDRVYGQSGGYQQFEELRQTDNKIVYGKIPRRNLN